MKLRPAALIIKNDKVLTMKYIYPNADVYTLPGGNLEFGEELQPALERELQEELGIIAQIGKLKFIAQLYMEGESSIHFIFECDKFENEPKLNPEETKANEIVWLPLPELKNINLYPDITKHILNPQEDIFLGTINQIKY